MAAKQDASVDAAVRRQMRRGFFGALATGIGCVLLVAVLWGISRDAPSASGERAPTPAPTPVRAVDRFGVTAFPTSLRIEGALAASPDAVLRRADATPAPR